jgi:hypothetical protein
MLMPGRPDIRSTNKNEVCKLRQRRDILYIVSLNGPIDSNYINDFINYLPVFRNIDITPD